MTKLSGTAFLALSFFILFLDIVTYRYYINGSSVFIFLVCFGLFVLWILSLKGLKSIEPNQAMTFLLFGRYVGTIDKQGFYWVNPFYKGQRISLKIRTSHTAQLKVNDKMGNPIEIGCIIVWHVTNPFKALFDVDHFESYILNQSETALRQLAMSHPYDHPGKGELSLRGGSIDILKEFQTDLTQRMAIAGIEIVETRISHLAYSPEIASAMLQRQQAEAILAAREKIVDGATEMVKDALRRLEGKQGLKLTAQEKSRMVANLMVTLCSEQAVTPVLNISAK
ncbi:SPFH domain-containing protein [Candidatus Nucleicultrix amoebiphila]|jgi:regulator of protease activity HflC (stomatin/prohibitin superfamily)|uniref:Band 7 domain-containing protein n=1 Tax=Candidatus Nucleicultrix amoebiphila FS5 TaxID=1414854 RepID=A0A1W6N387_9PROT|nr:SPFH domain-containing protein [Candidatus Nucleicultrix amoebiphila]ARN84340.1 hypothetical protein GQ61_02225 [Candidatus Nucleicultrix amoebiphila FS5]